MKNIFEVLMLVCFGISWPVSIYKSIKTKCVKGKSILFLYIIVTGYIFGAIHKYLYLRDWVLYLYILNGTMVIFDIILWYKYKDN